MLLQALQSILTERLSGMGPPVLVSLDLKILEDDSGSENLP